LNDAGKRLLSPAMATALVVGNMIGSGIFLLPASMASYGGVSVLAWAFTAGGAMLLALTFAWLARSNPAAGGMYAYTRLAFGDFAGFLVAWSYWISIWITVAAIAVAMISYLSVLVPPLAGSGKLAACAALAALWTLTGVNLHGVRSAGFTQLVTVALKLLPLFLLMAWGVWYFEPAHFVPFNPGGKPLLQAANGAAALALWSMLGLESATIAAAKVRDPARNVARATLFGTALAALATATACTIVIGMVPPEVLRNSNAPFADAARIVWGDTGATLMAATGALSCFGCLNGWILLQGQLPQAMARDGLFPAAAADENSRGVPALALVLGSVLASILIWMNYSDSLVAVFTFLALLATLATLIPYLFSTMAALRLLRGDPATPLTGWRVALLLVAFAYALWTVAGAGQETVYWGFLLLLSGLPVYVWLRRATSPR
jgi:APA family basic amino acid/polyamine antiporter